METKAIDMRSELGWGEKDILQREKETLHYSEWEMIRSVSQRYEGKSEEETIKVVYNER